MMVATKLSHVGARKSLARAGWECQQQRNKKHGKRLTICAASVKMKVVRGLTFGRIAKEVSPTKPLVTLLTASASTGSFK